MEALTATLTEIAGRPIEITVRGDNDFTFSYEGDHPEAAARLGEFFGMSLAPSYDEECDFTCVYATLKKAA